VPGLLISRTLTSSASGAGADSESRDGRTVTIVKRRAEFPASGRTGARVRAVRCWMPIAVKGEAAVTAEPVPSHAVQQARARRELAEILAAALLRVPEAASEVDLEHRVIRGPAGPWLVDSAFGADLLVVGHGPRVAGLLHRSVSWYCVRHAMCPALVIPPAMATRRTL
jgi:nucleotide-binding universal stress UspA family protein